MIRSHWHLNRIIRWRLCGKGPHVKRKPLFALQGASPPGRAAPHQSCGILCRAGGVGSTDKYRCSVCFGRRRARSRPDPAEMARPVVTPTEKPNLFRVGRVTSSRTRHFLVGLAIAVGLAPGHAAAAACPPAVAVPPRPECPAAITSPAGLPTHGGTITVYPGIQAPCVVRLPGGAVLCAGGETAAPYGAVRPHGRAIFRISGSGPHGPGGLNIVVSAASSDAPIAPELLPRLYADAALALPPGTVLVQLDPATGRFVPIRHAHIRVAGLYKIVPRGASATLLPVPPPPPATLPPTGGSPFAAPLALAAALFVAGWWLVGRRQATGGRRAAGRGGVAGP